MCSEPCGIGKQTFKRKESPWGNKGAADCGSHESKKEECILSGCTRMQIFFELVFKKYDEDEIIY